MDCKYYTTEVSWNIDPMIQHYRGVCLSPERCTTLCFANPDSRFNPKTVKDKQKAAGSSSPKRKIIAVDFDGTLCENHWPDIGPERHDVITRLREEKEKGARVILWTCREGTKLADAFQWCEERGIIFDAVNANLPEIIGTYGADNRKIFADEYWDDKAVKV